MLIMILPEGKIPLFLPSVKGNGCVVHPDSYRENKAELKMAA